VSFRCIFSTSPKTPIRSRGEADLDQAGVDTQGDRLDIEIADDGKGMDPEFAASVIDPFVTTRTTRKVGLGIPMLAQAARACDGDLTVESAVGKGTTVRAGLGLSHIDRAPVGDIDRHSDQSGCGQS